MSIKTIFSSVKNTAIAKATNLAHKVFSTPATSAARKEITLYQAYDAAQAATAPMEQRMAVFTFYLEGDDKYILDQCFGIFNSIAQFCNTLNYSMSVGDVVQINKLYYECMPNGWRCIDENPYLMA